MHDAVPDGLGGLLESHRGAASPHVLVPPEKLLAATVGAVGGPPPGLPPYDLSPDHSGLGCTLSPHRGLRVCGAVHDR